MCDRDKLCSESSLYIMGDVFDGGGDGVLSHEWRVHNNAKVFHLEISLVQGFEGTTIIEVMVEWYSRVRICDGSDKSGMFSREQE